MKKTFNKGQILKMFGAQTYGTLINTLDKLATVPLFIFFWGVDLFGEWLILRAIPSYLAVAELGFATAAANRMSVLLIHNRHQQALSYFQSTFWVLAAVSLVLVVVVSILFVLGDAREVFNFSSDVDYDLLTVVMLMLGYTLLVFQTQLLSAAYRSVGRYVSAAFITYNIRALEICLLVVVVLFGGGICDAALSYFLVRLTGIVYMASLLLWRERWLRYGFSQAKLSTIKEMLPDAAGFFAFPFGQAMSLQGGVFILAYLSSPALVALFSASRTMSRTVVQLGMQINRSVWPELTRLCAAGNREQAKIVYFIAAGSFFWLGIVAGITLLALSPYIFEIWTAGEMQSDSFLFALLITSALLNGFWYSALSILAATDNHKKVGFMYVMLSSSSMLLAYWLGVIYMDIGVAVAILVSEALMMLIVVYSSLKEVKASFSELVASIISLPVKSVMQLNKRHSRD
jgi:O-antigen/teichoic acid export membrane protein